MVNPDYPLNAREANIRGIVELGVTLDLSGTVTDAHGSEANPILIKAAEGNARQWIWCPFPAEFDFPRYRLEGKPKSVIFPPTVKVKLPDRIEIIGTPYHSDFDLQPLNPQSLDSPK
jgi:Gram-negative bacterial TonB protein C-terminal